MEIGAHEIALIGVGGTVVGAIIGAWISYRLAVQLEGINSKKHAGRRFVSIFHAELSEVYPYPINWPKDIASYLESRFNKLNAAVGEYRHYLPHEKRSSFR